MDRGDLRVTDLGIAESDTTKRLTLFLSFNAYHGEGNDSTLQYSCWEIPWTEEPGELQSMGSQRVRHNWACMHHHQYLLLLLLLFCHWVMSNSLWPHGLQNARLPCPSPPPGVCSDLCLLSRQCYLTISSSVAHFFSCLQSFPASGSFSMSHLFTSGGQSIGASASTSVLPMNIQDWFPLGLTYLISLLSKGLSRVFSSTTAQKYQVFSIQPPLWSNPHICTWLLEKPKTDHADLVSKVLSLLFNTLSRFVIAFLPRIKNLLINGCSHCRQWFWSPIKEKWPLFPFIRKYLLGKKFNRAP